MLDIGSHGAARVMPPERLIQVCVIGSSQTLADACHRDLAHLCPAGYHLHECLSSDVPGGYDIYVCDFESSPALPAAIAKAGDASKIVVVRKGSLSSARRRIAGANVVFVQTPMTPLALRAVLESAVARVQIEMIDTNSKLRAYDRDRANFLARAIHDIRVPLMAIQGYCGLFLAGQLGALDAEQTKVLERMQRSLTRLGRLVEAMLDLGAGSQATDKLSLGYADIQACVQQGLHEVRQFVEKKQIELKVDVEPPDEGLLFDAEQLEQVLVNLLDNACKFTPQGGSIHVRGRSVNAEELGKLGLLEAAAGYRVDVSDTGRGIDPDHIERIFDEHTSFGGPLDRSGWGLGLAICRMIIQAHNGRIWADSGAQGSSFSFVLPLVHSFDVAQLSPITL
jgi:signal transduction histidine kinase